ncbi:MAG: 30S ribosomal protein S27ae [archaeon]
MAEKAKQKKKHTKGSLYKIEGERLVRARKSCPKCGHGVFLADHKDRVTCGNCSFTEMKKR